MKRPSNSWLIAATLWAAVLVTSNYLVLEAAGWATIMGVAISANFDNGSGGFSGS